MHGRTSGAGDVTGTNTEAGRAGAKKEKDMRSFWLTFNEREAGCVEAKDEQAAAAVAKEITGFDATSVKDLPYPAAPRINKYEDPRYGVCPSFCFTPKTCCGRTSCPQSYSCVE
jgi:hypothetical protein